MRTLYFFSFSVENSKQSATEILSSNSNMGNSGGSERSSSPDTKSGRDNSQTHYETRTGSCATFGEVMRAGAAEAALEDHDSPAPIADAVHNIVDGLDKST
jgi:hypothetical protein